MTVSFPSFVSYVLLTLPSVWVSTATGKAGTISTTALGFVDLGASSISDNRSLRQDLSNRRGRTRRCRFFNISSSKSSDNDSTSKRKRSQGGSSSSTSPFTPIDYAYAQRQISNIFGSSNSGDNKFVPLSLAGRWSSNRTIKNNNNFDTIWLSTRDECQRIADAYEQYLSIMCSDGASSSRVQAKTTIINGLPIPLSPSLSQSATKLLTQTYSSKPISKSLLLIFNSLVVNRDGGLFDNLPWSTWTIDPARYEKDAADNVLEAKYTMGKRVAYQRFMGKDWKGRSLSLGNLANRLRFLLEKQENVDTYAATLKGEGGVGREELQPSITDYYDDRIEEMQSTVDEGATLGFDNEDDNTTMMLSLSQRLLQLEIKEALMDIAECEQQLAIISVANSRVDEVDNEENARTLAEKWLEVARERLTVAESSLKEVMIASLSLPLETAVQNKEGKSSSSFPLFDIFPWSNRAKKGRSKTNNTTQSLIHSIINKFLEQDNPPPYRGAIGYPPILDSKEEMLQQSIRQYSSPYELLLEIIDEQLNSVVLGCVLEQTSLLEGNLVLGGALLLQRKGVPKSSTLLGEMVFYTDEDDDLGNDGVLPKSMYVVECFSDEALGVAIASGLPLFVEASLYERAGGRSAELDVESVESSVTTGNVTLDVGVGAAMNRIPLIRPLDRYLISSQAEGERITSERESNFVRIPLTTNPSIFDAFQKTTPTISRSVFSTFSPVKTLDEYDTLTDDAKIRLLLKLESFTGSLPRPRALRSSIASSSRIDYGDGSSPPSLLDELLVPLIDESIRRQYRIRDAMRRKDYAEADQLQAQISPRQAALEKAQRAREDGLDERAVQLEEEAELYKALRADVTQDELAYDRFLDRDEWYERETRARLKRLDRSKFGTLLDGVDLP